MLTEDCPNNWINPMDGHMVSSVLSQEMKTGVTDQAQNVVSLGKARIIVVDSEVRPIRL